MGPRDERPAEAARSPEDDTCLRIDRWREPPHNSNPGIYLSSAKADGLPGPMVLRQIHE